MFLSDDKISKLVNSYKAPRARYGLDEKYHIVLLFNKATTQTTIVFTSVSIGLTVGGPKNIHRWGSMYLLFVHKLVSGFLLATVQLLDNSINPDHHPVLSNQPRCLVGAPLKNQFGIWQYEFPLQIKLVFIISNVFANFSILVFYFIENCVNVWISFNWSYELLFKQKWYCSWKYFYSDNKKKNFNTRTTFINLFI